jgi:hypothetical protein
MITALLVAGVIVALIGTHQVRKWLDARLVIRVTEMEAAGQRARETRHEGEEGQP